MAQSCFSASGVGDLINTDGIMNAEKCCQILICDAFPSGKQLMASELFFSVPLIPLFQ